MATAVTTVKAMIRTKGAISGIAGLGDGLKSVEGDGDGVGVGVGVGEGEGDGLREGEGVAAK
jgi:hypothetical protein